MDTGKRVPQRTVPRGIKESKLRMQTAKEIFPEARENQRFSLQIASRFRNCAGRLTFCERNENVFAGSVPLHYAYTFSFIIFCFSTCCAPLGECSVRGTPNHNSNTSQQSRGHYALLSCQTDGIPGTVRRLLELRFSS